jgi:hypothetical protein
VSALTLTAREESAKAAILYLLGRVREDPNLYHYLVATESARKLITAASALTGETPKAIEDWILTTDFRSYFAEPDVDAAAREIAQILVEDGDDKADVEGLASWRSLASAFDHQTDTKRLPERDARLATSAEEHPVTGTRSRSGRARQRRCLRRRSRRVRHRGRRPSRLRGRDDGGEDGRVSAHLPVISNSEMRTFRACRRLHHLQYDLLYRPAVEPDAFRFGTLFHRGLEAWWLAAQTGANRLEAALAATQLESDPFERSCVKRRSEAHG